MPARINKKIRKGATNENPRKSCVDACPCARATTTGSARAFHSAAQPQNLHFPRRETIFFLARFCVERIRLSEEAATDVRIIKEKNIFIYWGRPNPSMWKDICFV